jgi:ferrous iron transport protein A
MQLAQYTRIGPFLQVNNEEKKVCYATTSKNSFLCRCFPLALANEHEIVEITSFQSGERMQERLLSMGLRLGDEIEIIKKQHGGAVLIEKNGNRYALGGGMALKIQVNRKKDGKSIG